eukprot:1658308-Karenia_brevis.AAC.1
MKRGLPRMPYPSPGLCSPGPISAKKISEKSRGINVVHLDANQAGQRSPAKSSSDLSDRDMSSDDGAPQAKVN